MGGLLDALMTFDFGQVVIDNEIAQMLKRVRRGFEFSPEAMSIDEIKETGPAGMYAGNPQTLERMTAVNLLPELADRKTREQWSDDGSSTIRNRAMDKALDILSTPTVHAIDDADRRVKFTEAFDDLGPRKCDSVPSRKAGTGWYAAADRRGVAGSIGVEPADRFLAMKLR